MASDYILVVDTESSGIPRNWNAPFEQLDKWPNVVQLSWLVYQWDGTLVKQEDHFIANDDYTIEASSRAIHHISDEILKEKGEHRKAVLALLETDVLQYKPIVVGHFVELDYKLLNVEYCRIGQKKNPLQNVPLFCTMLGAVALPHLERNNRQLKLTELYHYLFSEEQPFPHNALYDALATARCFFKEREILSLSQNEIVSQKPIFKDHQYQQRTRKIGVALFVAAIVLLAVLIYSCR